MKRRNKGFTIVELIIVIVILGVLTGVSVGGVYKYVNDARVNTDINNCNVLSDAIEYGIADTKLPSIGKKYAFIFLADSSHIFSDNLFSNCVFMTEDFDGSNSYSEYFQHSIDRYENEDGYPILYKEYFSSKIADILQEQLDSGKFIVSHKSQTDNSFYFIIYVDSSGCSYNVVGGIWDTSGTLDSSKKGWGFNDLDMQSLIARYDDSFKFTGSINDDSRILYDSRINRL